MAIAVVDMVMQTSNTQGVGALALTGTVPGWSTFAAKLADGAEVTFGTRETGGEWEVARGFLTHGSPPTLSRVQIYDSSLGGAAINWGAGERVVYVTFPAALMAALLNAATLVGLSLLKAENLADLPSKPAARSNLGLGSAATKGEGAGSTLDADTVDGLQAAAFALAGHNHSGVYAPVSHSHQALTNTVVSGGSSNQVLRVSGAGAVVAAANTDAVAGLVFLLAKGSDGVIYQPGSLVPFSGVAGGTRYYLGTGGNLTSTAPTPSPTVSSVAVGVGVAAGVLLFRPTVPVVGG